MKRCPYCAEEIQDAAIKCRFCGSLLTQQAPAGPAATPLAQPAAFGTPGGEALQYSHSGQRYLLGYGIDFFGIWDRQAPGPPVERFPRTDDGWRAAWTRYSALEPNPAEVGLTGAPGPAGPVAVATSRKNNGFAVASLVLGIVGLLGGVPSILALIFGYVGKRQIDRSGGAQSGRGMAVAGIVMGWIGVLVLIIAIVVVANRQ